MLAFFFLSFSIHTMRKSNEKGKRTVKNRREKCKVSEKAKSVHVVYVHGRGAPLLLSAPFLLHPIVIYLGVICAG